MGSEKATVGSDDTDAATPAATLRLTFAWWRANPQVVAMDSRAVVAKLHAGAAAASAHISLDQKQAAGAGEPLGNVVDA